MKKFSEGIINELDPNTSSTIQESIKKRKNYVKKLIDTFRRRFYSTHPPYDSIDPDN